MKFNHQNVFLDIFYLQQTALNLDENIFVIAHKVTTIFLLYILYLILATVARASKCTYKLEKCDKIGI